MKTNRLGCFTGTGLVTALITTLVIAGYAYARGGALFNPGPLSTHMGEILGGVQSHAEIGEDCKACHTTPWEAAVMADRCVTCHTRIADEIRDVASMHGQIAHDNPSLACRHCHPEHRGPNAPLTELGDESFPHEAVGFSLNGHQFTAAREPFACADCHADDITAFHPDTCDTCHRQQDVGFIIAHNLSFGAACIDCHDGVDRFDENFNHSVFPFQLKGKHAGLSCDQCHSTARAFGDFAVTPQDCYSCHHADEPHDGRFGFACVDCHTEDGWSPARFDHDLASFKLVGEHAELACESCHVDRVFQGTPQDCFSCHQQDDEHNGQFGTDCSACHNPTDWDDADFDHNLSNFPLTGGHVGVACENCHSSGQFAGLSTSCASCHGEPAYHAGLFSSDCASCHSVNNWSATYRGPHPEISDDDDGGRGVNHGGASCQDCHTQTLHSATCLACHDSNDPDDDSGGDDDDDDDDDD
jgi:hypothetical protein